jgi:signal transduction histidine kinase
VERTVQGLLNIVKNPRMDRHPLDLRELIDQEVALIQPRADRLQVRVLIQKPDLPVEANVDRDQFLAVLTNLMLNALDASSAGGRVEITLAPPIDGKITLSIADTGPGISRTVSERLFQPFTTTKPAGTGLGLSVSQSIVREHGGTITAGNRPEGGACFTISLPISQETRDEAARRR